MILAGGYGTRLSEETEIHPKPMVSIGRMPILWHIMKIYSHHGFNDFLILLGYKGYMIKEYFCNYFMHQNDVTIDLSTNCIEYFNNVSEPWRITLLDTGNKSMTGGRLLRAQPHLDGEAFMLTYGDGVADVDVNKLLQFHRSHGKAVTATIVKPEGRFGSVAPDSQSRIERFCEKPQGDGAWINGGFFVCQNRVFKYLTEGDQTIFERAPLENLARDGELYAYHHEGFWKCMDTLRDKIALNEMWNQGRAPWKLWA